MARVANKLSERKIRSLTEPGRYGDGNGLWLQIVDGKGGPSRSWLFRYTRHGRARMMGLGPVDLVSLQEAREQATEARKALLRGVDPLDERKAQEAAARRERSGKTFKTCAEDYIAAHEAGWRNPKHRQQWRNTLESYAAPVIGDRLVKDVSADDVLRVLKPIWHSKPETAARLRGRIEKVLSWAATQGLREGENPARWKGHLEHLLPAPSKLQARGSHAALPWAEMPGFFKELRGQAGLSAMALEFTILCASRTGETIGAQWDEVDLEQRLWTIPATRMKAGKEHRVPLPDRAVEILKEVGRTTGYKGFLFPGAKYGSGLSNMAMTATLRRMGRKGITVHGFRSTFKDWAAEATEYPNEISELALAHTVGSRVERAYRRSDLFLKRRAILEDWQSHCLSVLSGNEKT